MHLFGLLGQDLPQDIWIIRSGSAYERWQPQQPIDIFHLSSSFASLLFEGLFILSPASI